MFEVKYCQMIWKKMLNSSKKTLQKKEFYNYVVVMAM